MFDNWRAYIGISILWTLSGTAPPVAAHESTGAVCEDALLHHPLTLETVRARAVAHNQAVRQLSPPVDYFDVAGQARIEQIADVRTPASIGQITGRGVGAVATPLPTSPDEVSIGLIEKRISFVVHVKSEWAGRERTTAAYVTLPGAKIRSAGDYLIGPEINGVVAFLHGGGTVLSTGRHSLDLGEHLAPRGFATIAIDLPGHGIGTKNLHGLEDTEKQVNFILKVLNQLIHPAVPRVGVGHSWGAQVYAYAHRHSEDPKYQSFKHFVLLSPPVDASGCGDLRANAAFEADWIRRKSEFKHRFAKADGEFLDGFVREGRDSELGRIFCSATDRLYATPPLTPEEQRRLIPATVIVGEKDALVLVGREGPYHAGFGGLVAPSRYIELGRGQTFDGERDTGHTVQDLLDNEGHHLVYRLIGDILRDVTGYEPLETSKMPHLLKLVHTNFPDLLTARESAVAPAGVRRRLEVMREYVRDFDSVTKLAKDQKKAYEVRVARAYNELIALEQAARAYWNYVGFRTMLKDEVQSVETSSADLPELAQRKIALDTFERETAKRRETSAREEKAAVKAAVTAVAARLGLPSGFDVAWASEELRYGSLTNERRATLTEFVEANERYLEAHRDRADPVFLTELEQLSARYATTLAAAGVPVARYAEARARFAGKTKGLPRDLNQLRIELDNLHQEYGAATKAREVRATARRAEVLKPFADRANLKEPWQARRELDADRSPERRALLNHFIGEVEAATSAIRVRSQVKLIRALAEVPRPPGLNATAELAAVKADHDNLMQLAHAPLGAGLDDLVGRINDTLAARDEALKGRDGEVHVETLAKQTDELRQERLNAIAEWTLLWDQDLFTSAGAAATQAREKELAAALQKSYDAWITAVSARDLELQLADEWTLDTVLDLPPELRQMYTAYLAHKFEYSSEKGRVDEARIADALAGTLEPYDYLSGEAAHAARRASLRARELANLIWGRHRDDALTTRLKTLEHALEARRQGVSRLTKQLDELRQRYVERMRELGYAVPNDILRVRMTDVFNQRLDLSDLLERMDQEPRLVVAIEQMLQQWEVLMKQLRSLHNR